MDAREEKISDCKNDIEILIRGKEYIEDLIRIDRAVEERLNLLGNLCGATFIADNIEGLKQEQRNLNQVLTNTLYRLKEKVEREIIFLEDELQTLSKIDL